VSNTLREIEADFNNVSIDNQIYVSLHLTEEMRVSEEATLVDPDEDLSLRATLTRIDERYAYFALE